MVLRKVKTNKISSRVQLEKIKPAIIMTEVTSVTIKWAGKEYPIEGLTATTTVYNLKELIQEKTNVLPARQKLLNLKLKGII